MEEKINNTFEKIQEISIRYGCYEGLSADLGSLMTLIEDAINDIIITYKNRIELKPKDKILSDDEQKVIHWLNDIINNSVINYYYADKYANILLKDIEELETYRKKFSN